MCFSVYACLWTHGKDRNAYIFKTIPREHIIRKMYEMSTSYFPRKKHSVWIFKEIIHTINSSHTLNHAKDC